MARPNKLPTTHGKSRSGCAAYRVWADMLGRCRNPNDTSYKYYGGRGITVCERWHKFENFYADMGDRPPGMTIDRIRVNEGYSPDNCKWATRKEQMLNRRNNHFVTVNGVTKTISQWAEISGLAITTIYGRFLEGWTEEDAVTKPTRELGTLTFNGETLSWIEWDDRLGFKHGIVRKRIKKGWPVEQILSPVKGRGKLYECSGKKMKLSEWSALTGVSVKTMEHRLKSGWDLEKALTTPTK